jgi:hypothetical protein
MSEYVQYQIVASGQRVAKFQEPFNKFPGFPEILESGFPAYSLLILGILQTGFQKNHSRNFATLIMTEGPMSRHTVER